VSLAPYERRRRRSRFSIWTIVAPVALVLVAGLSWAIVRDAGWVDRVRDDLGAGRSKPRAHPPRRTTGPTANGVRLYYRVHAGDTLTRIAARFDTTIARLLVLNPRLTLASNLRIRERLRVR
jgi:hypothetical protein